MGGLFLHGYTNKAYSAAAKVNNCALCGKSMKFAMMVGIGLIINFRLGPTLGLSYLGAEPHLHKRGVSIVKKLENKL